MSQPPMQWVSGALNLESKVAMVWLTTHLLSIAEGYEGQKAKFHRWGVMAVLCLSAESYHQTVHCQADYIVTA